MNAPPPGAQCNLLGTGEMDPADVFERGLLDLGCAPRVDIVEFDPATRREWRVAACPPSDDLSAHVDRYKDVDPYYSHFVTRGECSIWASTLAGVVRVKYDPLCSRCGPM